MADYEMIEKGIPESKSESTRNCFSFESISYSAVNSKAVRKEILSGITGSARSGEMLAILGPSGAGKTSLLNVLTLNAFGDKAEITGKAELNGESLTKGTFKKYFCVVPQEDHHRPFLTCRETLRYCANFYINGSEDKKDEEVEKLLGKLGLEGCADTRVGNAFIQGLSGGQKKRLSIGIALLKSPSVLILDEPTSGLDAAASYHVMTYIKDLAKSLNIVVIATIHQPASTIYYSFDRVLLLSSGQTAYMGTPQGSVDYFTSIGHTCPTNTNPAEFLLDMINSEFTTKEQVDTILEKWNANASSELSKLNIGDTSSEPPSTDTIAQLSFGQQFYFVGQRQIKIVFGDPMLYLGRAIMFLFACSFFAVIYIYCRDRVQDQVLNRLWLIMWFVGVPTSLGVIGVYAFNDEFKTLKKEVKNGMYNVWAYLLISFLLQIPIMFVLAIFVDGIPGFAIANFYAPHFLEMTSMYAITLFSYECIARFLSVAFDNPLMGMLNYLQIWFTSFLFAGVMIPEDQVIWPFRTFFYIMPLKWSISTLAYFDAIDSVYDGASLCPESLTDDSILSTCLYHFTDGGDKVYPGWTCGDSVQAAACYGRTGEQILESLGANYDAVTSEDQSALNFGVISAIGITYQICYMIFASVKAAQTSTITPLE